VGKRGGAKSLRGRHLPLGGRWVEANKCRDRGGVKPKKNTRSHRKQDQSLPSSQENDDWRGERKKAELRARVKKIG